MQIILKLRASGVRLLGQNGCVASELSSAPRASDGVQIRPHPRTEAVVDFCHLFMLTNAGYSSTAVGERRLS